MATITALPAEGANSDTSLPDPTGKARFALLLLTVIAFVLAVVMNAAGWTGKAFSPAATSTANFALFAGFYAAAQVIERLMQLISPLVPFWNPAPGATDPAVKAAHVKADRGPVVLGVAALFGVAASNGFGQSSVSGRMRSPRPAARTIARMLNRACRGGRPWSFIRFPFVY